MSDWLYIETASPGYPEKNFDHEINVVGLADLRRIKYNILTSAF
jgi:hypothetical protein